MPNHLTCFLRNLYASQEATVRMRHETTGSKLGRKYVKSVHCHPVYLMLMYIMQYARLDESQAGIKIGRRNTNNLRCADDAILMAESEEKLRETSLLVVVKEESEKAVC